MWRLGFTKASPTTLMHVGNVNEFSVSIYVITLPKLSTLLWPDAYQTGIWPKPKLHVQKTDFSPRILVLEEWKFSSGACHPQSTSHSEERALSTHSLRGTVSLCLGESKQRGIFLLLQGLSGLGAAVWTLQRLSEKSELWRSFSWLGTVCIVRHYEDQQWV